MSDTVWRYDRDPEPIAKGGQSVVYRATRSDGLVVAIKVASGGPSTMALQHEIRILEALGAADLQGIMQCLDVIDIDGDVGMVMKMYPRHLGHWIQQTCSDPNANTFDDILRKTATISRTLAQVHGLSYANGLIVHRDIKPENIFIDDEDRLAVADFGGAMAINGLKAVELALFGTPMWAPLDQILPGRTIPDPTWDTYALCVILYAALTGSRPAYQSDPSTLLTPQGQELWTTAADAILGKGLDSKTKRAEFISSRAGTTASDLIDLTGHSALNEFDRELLAQKVQHLSTLAGVPNEKIRLLERGIWDLLCRGLSPVSHPSPPNRFRDGFVLAEQIEDLRDLLQVDEKTTASSPKPQQDSPDFLIDSGPSQPPLSSGIGLGCWLIAILSCGAILATVLAILFWPQGNPAWKALNPKVNIPPQNISVEEAVSSLDAKQMKRLEGKDVLVRSQKYFFDGGKSLSLYYETTEPKVAPTVILKGQNLQEPLTLTLPNLAPGRNRVTVQIPIPATIPKGEYRISFEDRSIRPLIRTTVNEVRSKRLVLKNGSVSLNSLVAIFESKLIEPFKIDRCEISRARWMKCVEAKQCVALEGVSHSKLPVIIKNAKIASQYCKWKGGDLPTVGQWLAAVGSTPYPWGDASPQCNLANGLGCGGELRPACATALGQSIHGVQDMAGNVREWVWSDNERNATRLMGGSYLSGPGDLGRDSILFPPTDFEPQDAGFRCVYPND